MKYVQILEDRKLAMSCPSPLLVAVVIGHSIFFSYLGYLPSRSFALFATIAPVSCPSRSCFDCSNANPLDGWHAFGHIFSWLSTSSNLVFGGPHDSRVTPLLTPCVLLVPSFPHCHARRRHTRLVSLRPNPPGTATHPALMYPFSICIYVDTTNAQISDHMISRWHWAGVFSPTQSRCLIKSVHPLRRQFCWNSWAIKERGEVVWCPRFFVRTNG